MPRAQRPDSQLWTKLRPQARAFRHAQTPAEDRLWQALRRKALDGFQFRRQHAIGSYIVDFYCVKAGLVLELDGPIHEQQPDRDANRQQYLESIGLTVLRFTNDDVLLHLAEVIAKIRGVLNHSPNSSPKFGEGNSASDTPSAK